MKKSVLAFLILVLANLVTAQDVIILKGERPKKGEIIYYSKDSILVYENKFGTLDTLAESELYDLKEISILKNDLSKKQFFGQIQSGLAFSQLDDGIYAHGEFRLAVSSKFYRLLQPGVGIGFDFYENYNMLPVYLSFFGVLSDKEKTFYYNARVGFAQEVKGKNSQDFQGLSGGVFSEWELGRRIYKQKYFFMWGIGLKAQHSSTKNENWGIITTEDRISRRLTLRIGIGI